MRKKHKLDIVGDTFCPGCRSKGRDSTGDHLMIFTDGHTYCKRCGYKEPPGSRDEFGEALEPEEELDMMTLKDIEELPSDGMIARGIDYDIAERYGIRIEYNGKGQEVAYYYPIHFKDEIIAYHKRLLPKTFERVGESTRGKKIEFFGQQACRGAGKRLLIVEAQDDVLAACQMLYRKYPKYWPDVVGSWGGGSSKTIADNLDFILGYSQVILCMDSDEAGQEYTEKAIKLIGQDKCRVMKIPTDLDPNEMLKQGMENDFISAFFDAKPWSPTSIVIGGVGRDVLRRPLQEGVPIDTLPGTMDLLHNLRPAELTLILAPAGAGKTTIMKTIGHGLAKAHEKHINVFLEEPIEKTQQSYIALDNDVSIARYRRDPSIISDADFNKSYDEIIEPNLWVSHWGSMSPEKVMQTFRYGADQGCKFGLLDHISMVFSGLETTNERKDMDILLTDLAAFVTESKMHVIVVSHIKRLDRPRGRRKPDDYPYWELVASDAGRGSGAFEQLAFNIISLEVEYLDEDMNKGRIRTRIVKNREWGTLGVGDVLTYDPDTGKVHSETRQVKPKAGKRTLRRRK